MATNSENTPARRLEDHHPDAAIDWSKPDAPAVPLSSTAGAARQGGVTSLEELSNKLHNQIMNLPGRRDDASFLNTASRLLYKEGHRDARHDAIECTLKFVADIERLLAPIPPLTAPAPLTAWQPIDTAPKDGSEVLLFLGAPWNRVALARWFDAWENWQEGEFPNIERDEYGGIGSALPTHWAHIPSAPGAAPAPQQSELSDERIIDLCEQNFGWLAGAKDEEIIGFARLIEREVAKAAPAAPVQTAPVSLPDGWTLVRGGDDIQLRRADGKWCGYSLDIDSPAHRLTHEFLAALLSASLAAPVQAEQAQAEPANIREALQLMVDRFGPCESDYIFSKRMAIQKARAALAAPAVPAQAEQAAAVRAAALEEAAKVAEETDVETIRWCGQVLDDGSKTRDSIAAAIRALATPSTTPSNDTSAQGDTGGDRG